MKAITQDRYGSSGVLRLDEVATPVPGADEVLVRVHAAGVGPEVWHVMTGRPYFVRLMGIGVRAPKQRIPGRDLAGTVEAVGSAAAAVATSGSTALQSLRDAGGVRGGQSVLIIGASGGVGTFAVQLAKHFDAHVTACAARRRRSWSARSAPTR